MSRLARSVIIALVISAVLIGSIVAIMSFLPSEDELDSHSDEDEHGGYLRTGNIDDIKSMKVKNELNEFELKKEGDSWALTGYEGRELNDIKLELLLESAANFEFKEIASRGKNDMEKYGLNDPEISADIEFADGSKLSLLFGLRVSNNSKIYVMDVDNEVIVLASSGMVMGFDYKATDLLSLKLMPVVKSVDSADEDVVISSVKLAGANRAEEISIIQGDESSKSYLSRNYKYYIEAPFGISLNHEEGQPGESLIGTPSSGIECEEIAFYQPDETVKRDCGLENPLYTAQIKLSNSTEFTFYFGSIDPKTRQRYCMKKDGDIIYLIDEEVYSWISADVVSLANKNIFNENISNVSAVSIDYEGKSYKFELKREKETSALFELYCNGARMEKEEKFRAFFAFLTSNQLIETDKGDSAENANAELTIRIEYLSGLAYEPDEIKYFKKSERRYLIRSNESSKFLCDSSFINQFGTELNNIIQPV